MLAAGLRFERQSNDWIAIDSSARPIAMSVVSVSLIAIPLQ